LTNQIFNDYFQYSYVPNVGNAYNAQAQSLDTCTNGVYSCTLTTIEYVGTYDTLTYGTITETFRSFPYQIVIQNSNCPGGVDLPPSIDPPRVKV